MESVANFTSRHHHHQLPFTLHHRRPSISKPISSLSFTTSSSSLLPSLKISSFSSPIRASFSNSHSKIPNSQHNIPISALRTTLIVAVTAAAVFLSQLNLKSVLACTPVSAPPPPATVESKSESDPETESGYEADPEEEEKKEEFVPKESEPAVAKTKIGLRILADPEMEKNLEERIASNPKDIKAFRILLAIKMEGNKSKDAAEVLDKLLVLQPDEEEWPLLKGAQQSEAGNHEASMKSYHGIISKNPFYFEAYHGLLSLGYEMKSEKGWVEIEEKIKEGLQKVKRSKEKSLAREISLLLGEVLICKTDYDSASTIYKDLIKEEPRDFLPYLAQVRLYTLLRNVVEAEASFEKFRRLVPEGDPLRELFENSFREGKLALQEEANAKLYSRR